MTGVQRFRDALGSLGWVEGRNLTIEARYADERYWRRINEYGVPSTERFFATPYLFAPLGVDLTLHTHTALNAFVGATALAGTSPLTALNLTILASLILNAVCAYALAWRITRDSGASGERSTARRRITPSIGLSAP